RPTDVVVHPPGAGRLRAPPVRHVEPGRDANRARTRTRADGRDLHHLHLGPARTIDAAVAFGRACVGAGADPQTALVAVGVVELIQIENAADSEVRLAADGDGRRAFAVARCPVGRILRRLWIDARRSTDTDQGVVHTTHAVRKHEVRAVGPRAAKRHVA